MLVSGFRVWSLATNCNVLVPFNRGKSELPREKNIVFQALIRYIGMH